MPNALIFFPLGSEVRQFAHSGLLTQLLDENWHVTVAAKVVDEDLRKQLDTRVQLLPLPKSKLSFMCYRIAGLLDKAHARNEKKQGRTGWQYKAVVAKSWKERLVFKAEDLVAVFVAMSPIAYRLCERYEVALLSKGITSKGFELLSKAKPDIILVNGPKARGLHPLIIKAKRTGIASVVLYHTWKDVSASARLTPIFERFGVWNASMRAELLRNNAWLSSQAVEVVGCAHFDCVGRSDLLLPEAELRNIVGLNKLSPFLLYVASAPWLVPEEERYIRLLRNAIRDGRLPRETQVVVRANPMDDYCLLLEILSHDIPEVVSTKPNWRWDSKINWCFQRKDDLKVYNSLLHYASVSVGVPSTATIECAIADLPTVNVGFDLPGLRPSTGPMRTFWQADFYKKVRASGAAMLARNPEEMVSQISLAMRNQTIGNVNRKSLVAGQLGVAPLRAVSSAVDLLNSLVNR